MSAIPLAIFLQLAATCAPSIAPETLAAVAHVESSRDPNTIHINGPGGGARHYPSAEVAAADARSLIAAGRSIDLGIMQINSRNLGWLGLDLAAAFDPCKSIAAGAHVLAAESAYNTGNPRAGLHNGYVAMVQRAELHQRPQLSAETVEAKAVPHTPEPGEPPLWDKWAHREWLESKQSSNRETTDEVR